MKKFNFFEKLWEHGRTLRRVGLVLVMCLITIPQAWALTGWYDNDGKKAQVCFWKNGAEDWQNISDTQGSTVDLGTVSVLYVKHFYAYAWKSGQDISWIEMLYWIYEEGADSRGDQHDYTGYFLQSLGGNNCKYGPKDEYGNVKDMSINCLSGLTAGKTYIFECCFNGDNLGYLSNGGSNYKYKFKIADAKTTFEAGKYIYFDGRNQTSWDDKDYKARFHFKRYDTSADITNVICSNEDKLENWVYYVTVPDGDYNGKVQINRINPTDNAFWNRTNVMTASDRSNASQNCLVGNSSSWDDWSPTWGTYCPPMSVSTLSDNGTTKSWGGSGTSGSPYLIPTSSTIKVSASSTSALNDANMTKYYLFKKAGTAQGSGSSTNTKDITASSSTGTKEAITVEAYNYYNSTEGTHLTSNSIYYEVRTPYNIAYNKGSYGKGDNVTDVKLNDVNITLRGATFTRTGYTQTAWNTNSAGTGGTNYNLSASYTANEALTLYPTWTAKTYTITFNAPGGDGGSSSATVTYDETSVESITNPTKSGYVFAGWYSNSGGTGKMVIDAWGNLQPNSGYTDGAGKWTNDGAVELYAGWLTVHTTGTYTDTYKKELVTYDGNDYEIYGISKTNSSTYRITAGEKVAVNTDYSLADNKVLTFNTTTLVRDNWIEGNHNSQGSGSCLNDGEFATFPTSSVPYLTMQDGKYVQFCVNGYEGFRIIAKDNNTTDKYFRVEIDGVADETQSKYSSGSGSIRTYSLTSGTHIIKITALGGNTSQLYGFSLMLPAASCTAAPTVSSTTKGTTTTTTQVVNCAGISSLGTGDCEISSYGFVYGTSENPTLSESYVEVGNEYTTTNTAFAETTLESLEPGTTYYVRAYATNDYDTGYGTGTSFTTHYAIKTGSHTNGSVTLPSSAAPGASVAISATPSTGYSFSSWTIKKTSDGSDVTESVSLSGTTSATFTMPDYAVTVDATFSCTTPTITGPSHATVCKDASSPELSVSASANGGSLSYQWYVNTTNAATVDDDHDIDGETSDSYDAPTGTAGTKYYYCVVTNTTGGCSATSDIAMVTVNKPTAITTQPSSIAKANVGAEQTLSLAAEGASLTYQWYSCDSNGDNEKELDGEDEAALSITPGSVGVTYYYCVVGGSCGSSQTSDVASITAKNAISPTLSYSSSVLVGGTLSASKTGTWGDGSITYTSSDDDIATVASDGTVTGVSAGSVTITATIADGTNYWGKTATSGTITVSEPTYDVDFDLTHVTYSSGSEEGTGAATHGSDFEVTFEAASRYDLPTEITVEIDGVEVDQDDEYTWDSSTGELVIYGDAITGAIVVTIEGVEGPIPALITYNLQAPDKDTKPSSLDTTSVVTVAATLKGDTLKNFTNMRLGSSFSITGKGKNNSGVWTAKIGNTPSDSTTTDANSVKLSFDIHSDYELNVSSVTLKVLSVSSGDQIYRAKLSDGNSSVFGRVKPSKDTEAAVVFGSFSGIKFSGTVTLTLWVWSSDSHEFRIKTPIQIDGSLTKKPAPSGYAITLGDHDNGSVAITDGSSAITSAAEDATVYLEATPNTGYTFGSWTVVKTEGGERVSVTQSWKPSAHFTMPDEPVTVSAEFTQVNYAIMPRSIMHFRYTVQVGEAEAVDGYARAHYGDVITLAQSSIADGYHLKTWGVTKTESGDEVTMASTNTFVMPAEDVTINPIVGKWYTVSFDANTGNDEDNPAPITQTAVDGAITMPEAPTKSGYTFVNWMIGGTTVAAEGSYTPPTDVTAYATWKETCAGGGSTEVYNGENVAKNSTTASGWTINNSSSMSLTSGSSNGYSYWYQASSNSTDYVQFDGSASLVSGDKIKIQWTHTSSGSTNRTLDVLINGSSVDLTSGSTTKNSVKVEAVYDVTSTLSLSSIKLKSSGSSGCIIYQVTIVPASGGSCKYVTYDGNGAAGGCTYDPEAHSAGDNVTVLANSFSHPGYSFTGWNTAPDGSGTGYDPNDDDHKTFTITGNTTLYAQWTPRTLYFTRAVDGDWTDPLNWKVSGGDPGCIPTIEHDVVIQGNVKLYGPYAEDRKGHGVAKSVRIEFGKNVDIWTEGGLIVAKDIKAKHAVDGEYEATTPDDLSIETTILGNGTLITGEENSTTQALYKFRTKAFTCYVNQDGKRRKYYYNQYCGIPFQPIDPMTSYYGCTIYEYGAATDSWITPTTEYLQPFVAYNLLRKNAEDGDDIWLRGTLNLPGTDGTKLLECGWRAEDTGSTIDATKTYQDFMFANSWTAPIDISSLDEEDCSDNLVQSIYMFNTGYEREKGVKEIGNKDGQWSVFPFKAGKYMKDAVIPGTQAFLVTAKSSGATLTLKYGKHVYNPALEAGGANNFPTRAPKRAKREEIAPNKLLITVLSDNTILDNMYIFEREDFTEEFDNGWDGTKIIGSTRAPQLYTRQGNNKMEVAAVPEMEGLEIGFVAGTDTNSYTFEFEYLESEPLYLYDRETMEFTPIENKGTYSFTTEDNLEHARFVLTRSKSPQIATGFIDAIPSNQEVDTSVRKIIKNDHVYILRGGHVYSIDGSMIK